jgi:hypothetical protein
MSSAIPDRFSRLKALQRPTGTGTPAFERATRKDFFREPSSTEIASAAAQRLEHLLGACAKGNGHGEHLSLHCWFGNHPPCAPGAAALRLLVGDRSEEAADPNQWLFLDTETTGLMGGTGTYPFLVGLAWWEGGGLEVEQLFMRDYSEERSVLAALKERLTERPVLVTFNGKSFDWPLLETRYRMSRKIPAPALRVHLDFLHPARNLWRLRLGSVRLSELERHVLGWDRGDDLISQMIPQTYFNFIRHGHVEPLVPVFEHNQMDLRGLAGLAERVLCLLGDEERPEQDALELYGVSRICERRGEIKRARKFYEQSIAAELPSDTDRLARNALAKLAKREGDIEAARQLWESGLGNSREGYEAYEKLAIHFEHGVRDPKRALEIAREALTQLHTANQLGTISASTYITNKKRFEHRATRLERKAVKTLLDNCDR